MVPLFLLFLICMVGERNRAPFDFVEGESELVSGYHIEYSGVAFALLFMAEYSSIFFNRVVVSSVFLGGSDLFVSLWVYLFVFAYL